MSARTGTFGDLTRYSLQRRFAEPLLVLVGGDVNYHGELPVPIPAVKRRDDRQISSQSTFAFF